MAVLAASFVITPQLSLAKNGADDAVEFSTPQIPLPSGVVSADDNSGRRTFRANTPSPSASASPKVEGGKFCQRYTEVTGSVGTDLTKNFNDLQSKFQQRGDKIKTDFKSVFDTQTTNRTKADDALKAKFASLEAKASTDVQKQAVKNFETAVQAAVTARRAAVDAANATFRQGLLDANSTRVATLKQAATDYRAAVQAALAAAKASCAAGADSQTVRNTLKSALDAAKAKLDAARDAAGKGDANLDALKSTRKAAVDRANADFRTAIKAALDKLKSVLGTSTPIPSPADTAEPSPTPAS